ncbi:tetratricopeptide repeat protein [Hirschia baltica]|uniref:Tetratricopeptide TPR_2 repeat protein n=1 Tax=Hirschia baltica (strain ATCC 49814 / DSM 5838 / IFAM 1418) TaxID=582402 RepID=C6XQ29_HIRBI|nr:tetratricopeptide repeat protein [Hirschia baltica]ACT58546.1 Tetratricopeptide TPR_2 repeat protein [Hirschia baltica ATCC 49814]
MATSSISRFILLSSSALFLASACTKPPTSKEEEMMEQVANEKQILAASKVERQKIKNHDMITQAKFWGDQFDLNPSDYEAAAEFANALRAIGSAERAVDVATQALALHPGDVELSKTLAKAHMDTGRPDRATNALYNAVPDGEDWVLYSLYGIALDQLGDHKKAQLRYTKALDISPDNQVILANYALSLALEGKPEEAEAKLRHAIASNEFVDPRVRLNLALILGVQGKFKEAEEISTADLPPHMVQANSEYFKRLLTPSSRSWNALRHTQQD